MYLFEAQKYFIWLAVIPVVIGLFLWLMWWRKRAQKRFASSVFMKVLSPDTSIFKPILKLIMICLTLLSMVLALVNPKMGTKVEKIKREGIDIVFALDVSRSMLAEDIAPSRIEKSKQIITQIINELAGDRIGLVVYAASAYPLLPMTSDYSAAKMFLQSANTDMLSSQGTAFSEALQLSQGLFNMEEQTNKVIIVVSDGEDHEGNLEASTAALKESGIKVFTIGIGKVNGGPIPLKQGGVVTSYIKDNQGETVITKLNETLLMDLASQADGFYQNGSNTAQVVDFVKDKINQFDKTEFDAQQFSDFKSQFQWFVGLAIGFLFIDVFFLERKTKWLQKLNLFNENA
ncbi:MAG: VWA domain-containing protein [Flavobacteriaceae bacterium]|nr:VWA domain-containing protein [Flavobacteriaceae bacterium]